MSKRVGTALALMAIGLPALLLGGIPYLIFFGFFITAAAWEYMEMFRAGGARPARWLVIVMVAALIVGRYFFPQTAVPLLTAGVLLLMTWHLVDYERGNPSAGNDFNVGVGALAYLGWVGAYMFELRQLEHGAWWVLFVLPVVWVVDVGAYMIGAAYGRHHMAPNLSPKKTWEGYAAGVVSAILAGMFFAFVYTRWGPLNLSIWQGAAFGLVTGLLTPLGDLGESMFKRQAGMKDSGNFLPGHGGAFDRIDSWLWVAPLGYYFITWFVR